jgi:hypothetical protein
MSNIRICPTFLHLSNIGIDPTFAIGPTRKWSKKRKESISTHNLASSSLSTARQSSCL